MQYVGKVGGYVYNQWNSLNPATLSGAIDIIVVEHADGTMHCSPWHVRFGKFQIIKPTHKKVDLYVNDIKTSLPMKLSDGGEAFFVFETDGSNLDLLSQSVLTSPVLSPVSSAGSSAINSPLNSPQANPANPNKAEPEALDLNNNPSSLQDDTLEAKTALSPQAYMLPSEDSSQTAFEKARRATLKLNIPSKIDINGDMLLDMDGYKPNSQRNIHNSDEYFKKILMEKIQNSDARDIVDSKGDSTDDEMRMLSKIITRDEDGSIRIMHKYAHHFDGTFEVPEEQDGVASDEDSMIANDTTEIKSNSDAPQPRLEEQTFFKSLRLTSEQLKSMNLKYGENSLMFKIGLAGAQVTSNLYLWRAHTPIVISDIDGTITKSDALGHVLNMFGRDWTHPGVANLFLDIRLNGYNVLYLTARSVGQADTTRQYLKNIVQDGCKLPLGPVILSPDRTMAALRREVILKKPEVFKMACLNDIKSLYFDSNRGLRGSNVEGGEYGTPTVPRSDDVVNLDSNLQIELNTSEGSLPHAPECDNHNDEDDRTPFYAGFGNRITDAISYRSVGIPSHRIFTINPNGEVHMELLELAGYKSSYLHIGELIDHFFPPIREVLTLNTYWNNNQLYEYMSQKDASNRSPSLPGDQSPMKEYNTPGSPAGSVSGTYMPSASNSQFYGAASIVSRMKTDEKFSDVNYWRDPINFSDLEDEEEENGNNVLISRFNSPELSPLRNAGVGIFDPTSPSRNSAALPPSAGLSRNDTDLSKSPVLSNDASPSFRPSAYVSPLKDFMIGGKKEPPLPENPELVQDLVEPSNESDYTEDEDYSDDDYDEDEDNDDGDQGDDDDEYDDEYDDEDDDEDVEGEENIGADRDDKDVQRNVDVNENDDSDAEVYAHVAEKYEDLEADADDVDEIHDLEADADDVDEIQDLDDGLDDDYDEDAADVQDIKILNDSTLTESAGINTLSSPSSHDSGNSQRHEVAFSTAADHMKTLAL